MWNNQRRLLGAFARRTAPVLLLICSVTGWANAQDSNGILHMDQGSRRMLASADTAFALKAAQGGLAEVRLGKLAAGKAASPDVKAFGQHMVDDHTKANEQLKSVAQEERMTLPADVNHEQQATYDQLSKLSGAEFDRAYVKAMVSDHQEDVKDFTKEVKSGQDAKIKAFASQILPVLEQHLEMIKGIRDKLSGS
jgi:putative membrane protein